MPYPFKADVFDVILSGISEMFLRFYVLALSIVSRIDLMCLALYFSLEFHLMRFLCICPHTLFWSVLRSRFTFLLMLSLTNPQLWYSNNVENEPCLAIIVVCFFFPGCPVPTV